MRNFLGLAACAAVMAVSVPIFAKDARKGAPAASATPPSAAAKISTANSSRLTAQDAETWLDGYMPYALKRGGVAGAVVVVVKDGQILVQKGYGVSDTKTGAPIEPKKTLFRPGSISKLFTWTAVMQQVEAGKINLDADINTYLDFKIPPFEGKPITMRNVMTHTTGLEEAIKGLIITDPKGLPTLEGELKKWVPTRVFAPGGTPAYSNYASALAGYVVQRVSGENFDAYVEDRIFKPLSMTNATFRQPLPSALASQMSKGYDSADKPAKPFELVPMSPAGGLSVTGEDMAKFMIAHLSDGGAILKPETARLMHNTSYQVLPPLDGMALGFFEERINNVRGIGHGGDTGVFHSHISLFPAEKVGLFVSLNSSGRDGAAGAIRTYLSEGFADRYFPGTRPIPGMGTVDKKTAAEHAALMASNSYFLARGAFSSFMGISGLLSQAKITVNDDGTITPSYPNDLSGAPRRYREVAPYVWQQVGGHGLLGAKVVDGKVKLWSFSEFSGAISLIPTPIWKSSALLLPLLGIAVVVLLGTFVAWPFSALVRRRYGARFPLNGARAQGYRWSRIFVLGGVAALAAWIFLASKLSGGLDDIIWISRNDSVVLAVQAVTLVAFLGGLFIALWNAWVVWTKGAGWFGKLWATLLPLAFAAFLWTFYTYNMINFSVNY